MQLTNETIDALAAGGTCPRCERCHVVVTGDAAFACSACDFSRVKPEVRSILSGSPADLFAWTKDGHIAFGPKASA